MISTLLISLYVDNGACCTNDKDMYQEFLSKLKAKYDLSDNGVLDWHLGMKITQDHENGTVSLDQTAYIKNTLTWKPQTTSTHHSSRKHT